MKIPEVLTTEDTAANCHTTRNALYTSYSKRGHWEGIRPLRIGRRLLWPADQVTRLLRGDGDKLRAQAAVLSAEAEAKARVAERAAQASRDHRNQASQEVIAE